MVAAGPGPHILLVGMMGVGKTTVGQMLAETLGRGYVDTDWQVEDRAGRSVADIFATEGEAGFRARETAALAAAVRSAQPQVISVAGGAVLSAGNRDTIRSGGVVIWLRARAETLAARVGSGEGRPLLAGDPLATLTRITEDRTPLYDEVAGVTVDVDEVSPAEVVDQVVEALTEAAARVGGRAGGRV